MEQDAEPVISGVALTGRISWMSYLHRHGLALTLVVASVAAHFLAIHAGPGKSLIFHAFALLVGTSSLLHVLIWLAVTVTGFQLIDDTLTFSRFGRRTRSARTKEIEVINEDATPTGGATIWLRNGTTLYFSFGTVTNSRELIETLCVSRTADGILEGCLNRSEIAKALVYQWLASCILLAIALPGGMCLAVFLQPKNLVGNPMVFLFLGIVLLTLSATGFCSGVVRYWLGCMHSFHWDGNCLRYRTIFSRTMRERYRNEIEDASARRPNSSRGESGTWRLVRFRDGSRVKLQIGTLQNADKLFAALRAVVETTARDGLPRSIAAVTSDHPLWPKIESHLDADESVLWLGRPVCRRLWSEMTAEMVFGLIPASFGIAGLGIGLHFAVKRGDWSVWPLILVGAFFFSIGSWLLASPWRYRRMLQDTIYAVTSKRVVILNGLLWGSQSAVQSCGSPVTTYSPAEAGLFEVRTRRRDIIFGGHWHRGRKGSQLWVNAGFLAADDPEGAETAIHYLLSKHPPAAR